MAGRRGERTLIVGLGNPQLGDDGVGHVIAQAVRDQLGVREDIDVVEDTHGGLLLVERLQGYQRAIVVDASLAGEAPGTVSVFGLAELPGNRRACAHDVGLHLAIRFGRRSGAQLPEDAEISFVAVEASVAHTFRDSLSPAVRRAVPRAVDFVVKKVAR